MPYDLTQRPGFAPPIPGVTKTDGVPANGMGPLQMVAAMMGMRPQAQQSSGDKMSQVVQLLREIGSQDPRLGTLTSEALRILVEGGPSNLVPPPMAGQMPLPPPGPMAGMMLGGGMGGPLPIGGPGRGI